MSSGGALRAPGVFDGFGHRARHAGGVPCGTMRSPGPGGESAGRRRRRPRGRASGGRWGSSSAGNPAELHVVTFASEAVCRLGLRHRQNDEANRGSPRRCIIRNDGPCRCRRWGQRHRHPSAHPQIGLSEGLRWGCHDATVALQHRPDEPPPTPWEFPDPRIADAHGIVCLGADLEPGTLLSAYRHGLFPMPIGRRRHRRLAWWSPDPRGVLPLDGLRVTRSLRRSMRAVRDPGRHRLRGGDRRLRRPRPRRRAGSPRRIRDAYVELHRLGWAHSVEA